MQYVIKYKIKLGNADDKILRRCTVCPEGSSEFPGINSTSEPRGVKICWLVLGKQNWVGENPRQYVARETRVPCQVLILIDKIKEKQTREHRDIFIKI